MAAISNFIFTRTAPKKKLAMINALTQDELLGITYDTVLRIIKEAGRGDSNKVRSKFKTLYLRDAGNNRNSDVERIFNEKNDVITMTVYVQGDHKDSYIYPRLRDFLDNRYDEICLGTIHEMFLNGYEHDVPANYNRKDRARVIKAILVAYVKNKYADKLKEEDGQEN